MLRRIGNKSDLASEIIQYFPKDITVFIDLFFGSGAITWEMIKRFPNLHYFANDLDNDVYNLWKIMQNDNQFDKLYEIVELTPYHISVYKDFCIDEPKNEISKALQFLYFSNYSLYGKKGNLKITKDSANGKMILLENMKSILKFVKKVTFDNKDFININLPLSCPDNRPLQKIGQFVYADPPYIGTTDNYSTGGFTELHTKNLIEKLSNSELRYCISEFLNGKTENLAKQYNLYITEIKERRSLKSRNMEIIMTNYKPNFQKYYSLSLFHDCN